MSKSMRGLYSCILRTFYWRHIACDIVFILQSNVHNHIESSIIALRYSHSSFGAGFPNHVDKWQSLALGSWIAPNVILHWDVPRYHTCSIQVCIRATIGAKVGAISVNRNSIFALRSHKYRGRILRTFLYDVIGQKWPGGVQMTKYVDVCQDISLKSSWKFQRYLNQSNKTEMTEGIRYLFFCVFPIIFCFLHSCRILLEISNYVQNTVLQRNEVLNLLFETAITDHGGFGGSDW